METIAILECKQIRFNFLKSKITYQTSLKIIYIYPFNYAQTNDWCWIKLLVLDRNSWDHLTVSKQMSSSSFKNVF